MSGGQNRQQPESAVPRQLVVGSLRHAVTGYAADLAGALDARAAVAAEIGNPALREDVGSAVRAEGFGDALAALSGIKNLHLQFTDRLYGETPELAADLVEALARTARVSVTLHDLPQPSDGEKNFRRRAAAYARVAEAAVGVACNSRHEALLLAEHSAPRLSRDVAVIPLPVGLGRVAEAPPLAGASGDDSGDDGSGSYGDGDGQVLPPHAETAILGYFYPGKGHAELIDAVARSGLGLAVVALGTAAPGHEGELAEIAAAASAIGVRFESTGYLDDDELIARCRRVAVPVAAHQHLSASASMNTWIAAGRRPLIPDGRYSRELESLRPGTVTVYAPDRLAGALTEAAARPSSTWIAHGTSTRPHLADTAERYLDWWATLP